MYESLTKTTPGKAPDGRLGDPLDVVEEKLEVHLDSTLAQSLATCSHDRNESSRLSAFNQEQEQFDSPSLLEMNSQSCYMVSQAILDVIIAGDLK